MCCVSGRKYATWHPERVIVSACSLGMFKVPKASSRTLTPTPARQRSASASATPREHRGKGTHATAAPQPDGAQFARLLSAYAMLEGLLLMLLAIGGTEGSPAAGVLSASPPSAVVGVWRGSWAASGNQDRVPIEAVLQTVGGQGQVAALVDSGTGGARR